MVVYNRETMGSLSQNKGSILGVVRMREGTI